MENKHLNNKTKKEEKLIKDIDQLEIQITEVKDKIHTLENEEKQESYKSNLLGVKKDNLKSNIEFYEEYSKKMNTKMAEKQTIYLKFFATNEYYDKLFGMYRDQHILVHGENSGSPEEISFLEVNSYFEKEMQNLKKQIDTLTSAIETDSTTINNLFENLSTVS